MSTTVVGSLLGFVVGSASAYTSDPFNSRMCLMHANECRATSRKECGPAILSVQAGVSPFVLEPVIQANAHEPADCARLMQ